MRDLRNRFTITCKECRCAFSRYAHRRNSKPFGQRCRRRAKCAVRYRRQCSVERGDGAFHAGRHDLHGLAPDVAQRGHAAAFRFLAARVGEYSRGLRGTSQQQLADLNATMQETLSVSGVLLTKTSGRRALTSEQFARENDD